MAPRKFNNDISGWDMRSARDLRYMFSSSTIFNQPIGKWNLSPDTIQGIFFQSAAFNSDISGWDVSKVTTLLGVFTASTFNQPVGNWDISSVVELRHTFENARMFDQDISKWNTAKVANMQYTFRSMPKFNSDISRWDTSKVNNMRMMFFAEATSSSFNQDLSRWDVSRVTNMERMFERAVVFNGNISGWDVSRVNDFTRMFKSASQFNDDLCSWQMKPSAQTVDMFDGSQKLSLCDTNECQSGAHNCAPWATCSNTDSVDGAPGWTCACDETEYGSCTDDYACSATIPAATSLQVIASPADPTAAYYVSNDGEALGTHLDARVLLAFDALLPPAKFIGRATLRLSKDPGEWPCSQHTLAVVHAAAASGTPGAGMRRLTPMQPAVEQPITVPSTGADLSLDVTATLRSVVASVAFLISDPNNCRSHFAAAEHPDTSRRPSLLLEWASTSGCSLPTPLVDPDMSAFFVVEPEKRDDVRQQCQRRGGLLAAIENEADNALAAAACTELPCYIEAPQHGGTLAKWLPQHPQGGNGAAAMWTRDGFWQSVAPTERLRGLCRRCPAGSFLDGTRCSPCSTGTAPQGATSAEQCQVGGCARGWAEAAGQCVDVDECASGAHSCGATAEVRECLSGLTHWYKLEPDDPGKDSHGGTRMELAPEAGAGFQFSHRYCVGPEESCLHWSPQPTPLPAAAAKPNNLQLRIPLAELALSGCESQGGVACTRSEGVTVTFWYKRWADNKFGPRERNLVCLRNSTAVEENSFGEEQSECLWALVLTSALQTHLATQVLELRPAGFFSISAINVLDLDRWCAAEVSVAQRAAVSDADGRRRYMVGLVLGADNTARLYLDFEQVGETLFLEWDSAQYRSPNLLEMEVVQMEGRADVKVFSSALSAEQMATRTGYITCPVGRCENTVGSFLCGCEGGYQAAEDGACSDVNECLEGTHNCRDPAACFNTEGGYECRCPEGLAQESLYSCESTDACARGVDNCHGFATCKAGEEFGSFSCECQAGWVGDGVTCRSMDPSELTLDVAASADGWIQPWTDGTPVEAASVALDGSLVTSYLAIGGGGGKFLRLIIQFDHVPPRVSQANLELIHLWRRDPDVCGAYTALKFTALDADISDLVDGGEGTRRLEELPGVELIANAPNLGRDTGRVIIDISQLVRAAVPDGGRLALSLQRDPSSPQICDDWFASKEAGAHKGPRLHVAYREDRAASLHGTTAVEPTVGATILGYDPARTQQEYEVGSANLAVGPDGKVAVWQFDNLPGEVVQASLVLSKSEHSEASGNSSCASQYALCVVRNTLDNETLANTREVTDGGVPVVYPVMVHHVRRLAVIDVTEILRRHVRRASIGLLLFVQDPASECRSEFRSSLFHNDSQHYGMINVRSSERPRLEFRHHQHCTHCRFTLSETSALSRSGGLCDCAAIGFAGAAITAILPSAFDGMHSLESLDLSGNNIKSLEAATWRNLSALTVLDLSNNLIATIESAAFSGMPNLRELWLQNNGLRVLSRGAFGGLAQLQVLFLAQNQVRYMELGAFNGLEKLRWLDLSSNHLVTHDASIWESLAEIEAVSLADNSQLRCVPVFPDGIQWVDISETRSGLRVFKVRPVCLPYGCPERPDLFIFSAAAFLQGTTKPFHRGIERMLAAVRPDAASSLDRENRAQALHVVRGDDSRCVCDGSNFCIDASGVPLLREGEACQEDNDCEAERCCEGRCAALDALDHRGAQELCAGLEGCATGLESTDGGRTCVDVNECAGRLDNCDAHAMCLNTEGSFSCTCLEGWNSAGAEEGVECVDVDECKVTPDICGETMTSLDCTKQPGDCEEPAQEEFVCENTQGSFTCRSRISYFGLVSMLSSYIEEPPRRWKPATMRASHAAAVHFPTYCFPEQEGAIVLMMVFGLLDYATYDKYFRRSGALTAPSHTVAGPALDLQPRELVLEAAAEIEVPVSERAESLAAAAGHLLRVFSYDSAKRTWAAVETLGMTSTGAALRARVHRFGAYVVLGVCRPGTFSTPEGCTPCAPGTTSGEASSECTPCSAGEYAPGGAGECVACDANSFSGGGAANCSECAAGKFARRGAEECDDCSSPGDTEAFECSCPEGFRGASGPCTDVDECEDLADECHPVATCRNTPGAYECDCDEGYRGNGFECADENECDGSPCDGNATCTNNPGSFACGCNDGFRGSGLACEDVDECVEQSPCGRNAECNNRAGSYVCTCIAGHSGNAYRGCEVEHSSTPCEESEGDVCHALAICSGTLSPPSIPAGSGVSRPPTSDGRFRCGCPSGVLGHGYGAAGCSTRGYAVRIVYAEKIKLSEVEVENLLLLLGDVSCAPGSLSACDHIHFTPHGPDLGVNVLFPLTEDGEAAARAAAEQFNRQAPSARRTTGTYPAEVNPQVGARVYVWNAGTTAAAIPVLPAGMEVRSVSFEAACAATGCWSIDAVVTTGSSDLRLETFNTLYLPYAVGSDALSYDYGYADGQILDTFQPKNFPCRVSDYVTAGGGVASLPVEVTGCCFGTAFDETVTTLGGDSAGQGVLGNYRVTEAFAAYASDAFVELCPGGYSSPSIDVDGSSGAATPRPEEWFPDGVKAGAHVSTDFMALNQGFVGMEASPGITFVAPLDAFIGQYQITVKVDEKELRTLAGQLKGTVGVEHTVDFFLGFASFKPASASWVLDSIATQANIHVEKTSFFSVSIHGVNDYTFVEYVNLRLVAVYTEDIDFSGAAESASRTVRTNSSGAAHFVQVTFTLGEKYSANANSDLVPLDSVRAGRGVFFSEADDAGNLHHKCLEYTASPANAFASPGAVARFNQRLTQACAPGAVMCASPAAIPDHFVAFNIPLGIDFFGAPSSLLDNNVFVELVVSAIDDDARSQGTDPNEGEAPWQTKTTLTASIPVVQGGVNIFCDGITSKMDLKDVANADIIVGSAASSVELSRLRRIEDVASSQLGVRGEVVTDSSSIEAGLLTLVIKGNSSYFDTPGLNTRGVSLELEDVVTVHLMESDGVAADGAGSQGKQAAIKALLAESPEDNSDSNGLDTDGYALNWAFFFTVDRAAQRAHLEPSARLLELCPFNVPRPSETGVPVLETCVSRRDVRFRDYPWRAGAVSTAMEVSHAAAESSLPSTSHESLFFTSVMGDSSFSRQLGSSFAAVIDAEYSLNGRFRRAFWVNPGYEWTPTQTGGASLFQLSQKLFLFALVTLDERLASAPGQSIFDGPPLSGAPQDVDNDGASEVVANLPKLPPARRRMLLAVDPTTGDGASLAATELAFSVSKATAVAAAFGVLPELVATYGVRMAITGQQACMGSGELQAELQSTLLRYVDQTASSVATVQVLSLTFTGATTPGGCGERRALQAASFADITMAVVFEAADPTFDVAAFAALPNVDGVDPISVSPLVGSRPPASPSTLGGRPDSPDSGSSRAMIAFAAAGAAGGMLLCCVAAGVMWKRSRSREVHVSRVQQVSQLSESDLRDMPMVDLGLVFRDSQEDLLQKRSISSSEEPKGENAVSVIM